MHACPQYLRSDTVPIRIQTWTFRRLAIHHRLQPSFIDFYHAMPCHAIPYQVLEGAGVKLLPTYDVTGNPSGVLDHTEFMVIARELLDGIRKVVADNGGIDGVLFLSHGAAQTTEEDDPEGYEYLTSLPFFKMAQKILI